MPRARKPAVPSPPTGSRPEPTDQELVERIRRADQAAFNLLYERYFQRVYGFTRVRLHNRADAEEVVQEIFLAVFRSIEAYRGRSSLLAWIYGIAKNTVNNHIRRQRSHEQRIERAETELVRNSRTLDSCTPEEHLNLRRCEEVIQRRMAAVSSWHAEAFVMRHVEDLSIGEIARRVRRSNDAVRSSLYRMKKVLIDATAAG